jgi:penicillin G amidase
MGRILFRLVVLAPLVAIAAGVLWLRSSLPQSAGHIALAGLSADVRVSRDARGIPTITAATDGDAAFALGFVHAQDRLFQMDITRRLGEGRLAEWIGERGLRTDRFMRVLGIHRAAERQLAQLRPELRAVLDSYAAGVNAYLAHRHALPPEYYLLNAEPEPWRPVDTLIWGKLIALQLAGNFRQELLHARLAKTLRPEDLQVLYPPYPKDAPVTLGDATHWLDGLPIDAIYASLPDQVGPRFASNNWVVDGRHTDSGKPVLANDPHLGLSAPSIWYLARIDTPATKLAGATAPGAGPFVILGHNARIAWGFTNTESDVEDLFIERVDPADPTRYLTPGGSQPFSTRQERILVRGGSPLTVNVRETRHGPVISDLGAKYAEPTAGTGAVLALQATWLADDDRLPEAIWAMNRATNWQEFRAALADFAAPQQNMVYADVDGNIGFLAPAHVPIRGKGDGWLPAPGWTGEYDWTGYIPYDELPTALNPDSGRIVSANNKIVPDSYPYFLGRGWDLPNRAQRINQLLDLIPQQSIGAAAAMQADTLSPMAKDLLPLMLSLTPAAPATADALDRLSRWDGRMQRDQVGPLLFAAWLRELNRTLLVSRLGDTFEDYWGMHPDVIRIILTEHAEWCDDSSTTPVETCPQQLAAALERALAELRQRFGEDAGGWQWGRPHTARFTHQLWSSIPILRRLFATAIPANGGYDTIDRGATPVADPDDPYADVHGPTLRMIVDLGAMDRAQFVIGPGQSGNPLSPHYADLMRRWRDHQYLVLDATPVATLVLAPP